MIGYIITSQQANKVQLYVDSHELGIHWTVNVKSNPLKAGGYVVYDNVATALAERGFDWKEIFFTHTNVKTSNLTHKKVLKSELKVIDIS